MPRKDQAKMLTPAQIGNKINKFERQVRNVSEKRLRSIQIIND